jgi:hypothetical protein
MGFLKTGLMTAPKDSLRTSRKRFHEALDLFAHVNAGRHVDIFLSSSSTR